MLWLVVEFFLVVGHVTHRSTLQSKLLVFWTELRQCDSTLQTQGNKQITRGRIEAAIILCTDRKPPRYRELSHASEIDKDLKRLS
jgi:hypothetical protein